MRGHAKIVMQQHTPPGIYPQPNLLLHAPPQQYGLYQLQLMHKLSWKTSMKDESIWYHQTVKRTYFWNQVKNKSHSWYNICMRKYVHDTFQYGKHSFGDQYFKGKHLKFMVYRNKHILCTRRGGGGGNNYNKHSTQLVIHKYALYVIYEEGKGYTISL